jgi:hypothetical protein
MITANSPAIPGRALLAPSKAASMRSALAPAIRTLIDKRPLIFNLRYYHEVNAENRWEGDAGSPP